MTEEGIVTNNSKRVVWAEHFEYADYPNDDDIMSVSASTDVYYSDIMMTPSEKQNHHPPSKSNASSSMSSSMSSEEEDGDGGMIMMTPPQICNDLDRFYGSTEEGVEEGGGDGGDDNDDDTVLRSNLSSSSLSSSISNKQKKKKKNRFTILLLAILFFLAIVIGVGAGLGTSSNNERDGNLDTSTRSINNNMADCLELQEKKESSPATQQAEEESDDVTADTDDNAETGGTRSGKAGKETSNRDDGSVRRDLRGSSKRRKLECEKLLASKSSKTDEKSRSKKTRKSAKASSSTTTIRDKATEKPAATVVDSQDEEATAPIEKPADASSSSDEKTSSTSPTTPTKTISSLGPNNNEEIAFAEQQIDETSTEEAVTTRRPTEKPTGLNIQYGPADDGSQYRPIVDESTTFTANPTDKPDANKPSAITVVEDEIITDEPILDNPTSSDYYKYTNSTTKCTGANVIQQTNINGPQPLSDKTNVAIQFFAFGDTPYDSHSNTCIDANGQKEEDCTAWDCTASSTSNLPADNTCTFEGREYECVRDSLLPYMNGRMEGGDAAFVAHTGDFIRGSGPASNTRCTSYSFESRKNLFSDYGTNFLPVPGDNDWNECYGYDINSNTDPMRELWRDNFAAESSPFHQFTRDFPEGGGGSDDDGSSRPTIYRQDGNPENYFFSHNNVAFFGINRPDGRSYISNKAPVDTNEAWVEHRLGLDSSSESSSCTFKSIVIIAHSWPKESLYDKVLGEYVDACGGTVLPVLSISGNAQPRSHCMTTKDESDMRVEVTVEAFQSGPLLISVVRDPDNGGDFFHVEDVDSVDSNRRCPAFP